MLFELIFIKHDGLNVKQSRFTLSEVHFYHLGKYCMTIGLLIQMDEGRIRRRSVDTFQKTQMYR